MSTLATLKLRVHSDGPRGRIHAPTLLAKMEQPWNPYPIRGPYFPVTTYGAIGDNATLGTLAFNAAFDACAMAGGGYVEVPAGAFRTGRITLRSQCYLLLRPHGIVQGSSDQHDYGEDWDYWAIVVGRNISNTGVIGPAAHDAAAGGELRGVMWQMVKSYDPSTNTLEALQWLPPNQTSCPGGTCRPGNLALHDATNVTIAGVSLTDSSGWCQLFRRCSNVLEMAVRVEGSVQWGTADGMDVESGTNLTFRDSSYKTGDDCLAFRSGSFGKLRTSWPPGPIAPVQRVRLLNLSLVSSSSAIKLEANTVTDRLDVGEIRDVYADGIVIRDTNRAIGIWQRTGHGAIRDVRMRNLDIVTRYDSKPEFWGSAEPLFLSAMPAMASALVRNITFEDVVATSENGALLSSLPLGAPPAVEGVRLLNVSVVVKATGNVSRPQRDYRPARGLLPETRPAAVVGVTFENVAGVEVVGGSVTFAAPLQPSWTLRCVNTSTAPGVRFERGWECHNRTFGVRSIRSWSNRR